MKERIAQAKAWVAGHKDMAIPMGLSFLLGFIIGAIVL